MGRSPSIAVVLIASSAALGAGCTAHKGNATLPPNGRPTAAALAAVDRVRVELPGTDCGGGPLDAGYPTTMVEGPTTCLRDADRSGARAFMRFTGRTYTSGAYRVEYASDGRGGLRIDVVVAASTGALRRDIWECRVPQEPLRVGVSFPDARVEPTLGAPPCHHIAD